MTKDIKAQLADLKLRFTLAGVLLQTDLAEGLTNASLIVEAAAKRRLTDGGHVSTGLLRASITHRLIDSPQRPKAEVGTNVEYAKDMEFGSSPHFVPIANLIKWAKRKGLDEDIAYAVQDAIAEHGTKPHPFLVPALNENKARILRAIEAPMKRRLRASKVGK